MPIYEYRCDACGHEEEFLQKISADPLVDCPACGRPELKRLVSAAAFRLKGGGWYETDFKDKNQKNLAGDKQDKSDSKSKEPAKGEAKKESAKPADKQVASKPAVKSESVKKPSQSKASGKSA